MQPAPVAAPDVVTWACAAVSVGTFTRVSIHGLREELLRAQLEAARLPATIVRIPYPCPNEVYEREMGAAMAQAKAEGITHVIFGDLFLEDVRAYREEKLAVCRRRLCPELQAAGMPLRLIAVQRKDTEAE